MDQVEKRLNELSPNFVYWEKSKDIIDQLLDIIFNYRQSGHPGGTHSKVHLFVTMLLSGVMRWDVREPEKRFGDRFIMSAGHCVPLVYVTMALLDEAMRIKFEQTGDKRYAFAHPARALYWEDLLGFRRNGGLSGHAEMGGKSLFLKFNTGPSGHGSPASMGEALALKRAGAAGVKVFAMEGEGGLTPGVNYETMNTSWGLALDNLNMIIDWNDFGIDDHPASQVLHGSPKDWFAPHGWRVYGSEHGEDWSAVASVFLKSAYDENPGKAPAAIWTRNRKGRAYLKYDAPSHGAPHGMNSEAFWSTKKPFIEKYGAKFTNFGGAAPADKQAVKAEFSANLKAVMDVLRADQALVDYLAGTLVALGDSVPKEIPTFRLGRKSTKTGSSPYSDPRLVDFKNYPADLYAKPGDSAPNRAALAKWGAWANAFGAKEYGRPVVIACSADLAESTNISGFAKPYGDFAGYGWYERQGSDEGALLPTEITEFANMGLLAGMASVNFASDPEKEFDGFWGAASTYGSFSYLKYGAMRLFSQLAQDCDLKVGKIIYVAGHSGPETADDSRTHFGIYEPAVMQLFPKGHALNLHPWEHNEVPVLLAAALATDVPIITLNLTRPPVQIPDREKLGIPSHFEAAKGAYILRDYKPGVPRGGMLVVQGTSAVANVIKLLPDLDEKKLNVKIVVGACPELFTMQPKEYQDKIITPSDRADSSFISTAGARTMSDWTFNDHALEYAMTTDWDDRWRTGGDIVEVLEEAHLSPKWILAGIERFVKDRPQRLKTLEAELEAAKKA
jgi:transketolase